MTDDDVVATACTSASGRRSGVDLEAVVTADCCRGVWDRRFDRILCNPPTHAGSAVLEQLCREASDVLAEGGALEFVHHRGVAVDRHLEPRFGELSAAACRDYRLVTARN